MEEFGNFDDAPNNLNFDNDDMSYQPVADPFAMAGGMQMNSQSSMSAPMMAAGPKHGDYTEEELEIIQRVEQEQQDRKRQLYEK